MEHTPDEEDVRAAVNDFLRRELPQIQMHGGESAVTELDVEAGMVRIELSGTCSGCGISPMTIQAIRRRLPQHIDVIDTVEADIARPDDDGADDADDESRVPDDDEETEDGGVQAPF